MKIETIVSDVKGRVQAVTEHGQGVVKAGVDTLKATNAIVVDTVQSLVKTQVSAGREIAGAAHVSYEKARSESAAVIAKTGEELSQTLKHGYEHISAKLKGEPYTHREQAEAKKAEVKAKKAAAREADAQAMNETMDSDGRTDTHAT